MNFVVAVEVAATVEVLTRALLLLFFSFFYAASSSSIFFSRGNCNCRGNKSVLISNIIFIHHQQLPLHVRPPSLPLALPHSHLVHASSQTQVTNPSGSSFYLFLPSLLKAIPIITPIITTITTTTTTIATTAKTNINININNYNNNNNYYSSPSSFSSSSSSFFLLLPLLLLLPLVPSLT